MVPPHTGPIIRITIALIKKCNVKKLEQLAKVIVSLRNGKLRVRSDEAGATFGRKPEAQSFS
jgi:hypothetical protein